MSRRADIVARARALLGTRFRFQGRSAETGLDCIGVAIMAIGMEGRGLRPDYCLRTNDVDSANADLDESGLIRIDPGAAAAGDLLLVRPGPAALHVVILTGDGYIHADLRLRRTVEVPGAVSWPILSAWRHPAVAAEEPLAPELVGTSEWRH